ncbi:unnamed protein product [Adineta ricciae]|uniref:Caspase family p20 domain-containing protein n=1 Tax=Adineta ricciae TaxID=249248 RepID=A0A814JRM0_ADIRI|nr:unnamed protein product [Adineta ricciae]
MNPKQALAIGNVRYEEGDLTPCAHDARDTARSLRSVGFQVRVGIDLTEEQMDSTIDKFARSVRPGSIVVFYYSGHGAQFDGKNLLLPIDFSNPYCTDAQNVIQQLHRNRPRVVIVILDCCRTRVSILDAARHNSFFDRRPKLRDGLSPMKGPPSTIIAYGCAAGASSIARSDLRNSVYTHHLLPRLAMPNVEIETVLKHVAIYVQQASDNEQLPYIHSNCNEPIYLNANIWPNGMSFYPMIKAPDHQWHRDHHRASHHRSQFDDPSYNSHDRSHLQSRRYPHRKHLWYGAIQYPYKYW